MAEPIGALRGELSLSAAQFEQDIKAARSALRREAAGMERSMVSFQASVDRTVKSMANIGLVVAGAAVGMLAFTRRTMDTAASLQDVSDRIGVATDELQKFRYAAEMSGASSDTIDTALRRLARQMGAAAAGTGELRKVFDQYNIAIRNADGNMRSTADVFRDLSDAIAGAESHQERMRIAFAAFHTDGAKLVPMMREGAAAIDAMGLEAEELGVVLDAELVRKAADTSAKIDQMEMSMRAAAQTVALHLVPTMEDLAEKLSSPRVIEGIKSISGALAEMTAFAAENAKEVGVLSGAWAGFKLTPGPLPAKLFGAAAGGVAAYELLTTEAERLNATLADQGDELKRLQDLLGKAKYEKDASPIRAEIQRIAAEAAKTKRALDELTGRAHATGTPRPPLGTGDSDGDGDRDDPPGAGSGISDRFAREEEARKESLARQLDQIRQHLMSEAELINQAQDQRTKTLREALEAELLTRMEFTQLRLDSELKTFEQLEELRRQQLDNEAAALNERMQLQQGWADHVTSLQYRVGQQFADVLATMGQKSKAAAIAAVALNKGLMMAQAWQSTLAAEMRALAELGPLAGPPAAAKIKAWGAANVAMIGATSLASIMAGKSGGA